MIAPEPESRDSNSNSNSNAAPDGTVSRLKPIFEPVKKIGSLATEKAVEVKELLSKDRSFPSAQQLVGTVSPRTQEAMGSKKTIAEIRDIVQRSREVLLSAVTVFPPKLFQDSIIVDRTKITIIKRNFLWSADVISIRIEDVLNISTSVGPVFGSISIASRVMNSTDHFQIGSFWRNTAIDIKHVIQGYMIARNNNLDTDHLTIEELVSTLSELGRDSGP